MMTKDKLRQLSGDERLGQMRDSEYLGAEDIDLSLIHISEPTRRS